MQGGIFDTLQPQCLLKAELSKQSLSKKLCINYSTLRLRFFQVFATIVARLGNGGNCSSKV